MIGDQVAATAETWIDVPFLWQGQVRAGCDCKGLLAGVARELGRAEAESLEALAGDYDPRRPIDVRRLKAGLARLFDPATERRAGDVLLIRFRGRAQHVAIAAPRPNVPLRVIEALCEGPMRVRPFRRGEHEVDSIWRWRDSECR